jgi:hypothetical protein
MAMDEFRTRKMMEDAAEFEAGRVARERAFKREMQGTFQQNADLKRQVEGTFAGRDASQRAIHGTWDQRNKAAFDLQRIQDDAANWRTITADATARRGQDLEMRASTLHDTTARRGQDLQQDQALMQNATTRRGHDIQRDIHGWSYQTVKDYDPQTGFVTGEHIEPWRHGERVQQNGGGQTSAPRWAGVKPDKHFNDYMDSLTPEQRNVAYRQIFESGNTALLDHLKNDTAVPRLREQHGDQYPGRKGERSTGDLDRRRRKPLPDGPGHDGRRVARFPVHRPGDEPALQGNPGAQ